MVVNLSIIQCDPEKPCYIKTTFDFISTGQLKALRLFHLQPINLVIFQESITIPYLGAGLALEMLSALIPTACGYPAMQENPTTGTPGMRSPGSSRTTGNPPQVSTHTQDRDRQLCYTLNLISRQTISNLLCMSPYSSDYILVDASTSDV